MTHQMSSTLTRKEWNYGTIIPTKKKKKKKKNSYLPFFCLASTENFQHMQQFFILDSKNKCYKNLNLAARNYKASDPNIF